jgi:hypothetical protein
MISIRFGRKRGSKRCEPLQNGIQRGLFRWQHR